MRRLDKGIPDLNKLRARANNTHVIKDSVINYEKVIEAKEQRFRPKFLRSDFAKCPPRDDAMFRLDDRWINTQLENSRPEREIRLKNR